MSSSYRAYNAGEGKTYHHSMRLTLPLDLHRPPAPGFSSATNFNNYSPSTNANAISNDRSPNYPNSKSKSVEQESAPLTLKNRMVMAPLLQPRSTPDHVPTPAMVKFYADRASFGLIISESTQIEKGYTNAPRGAGIYSKEQVEGWKAVTDAVHAKGGLIFCQLDHCGRATVRENITTTAETSVLTLASASEGAESPRRRQNSSSLTQQQQQQQQSSFPSSSSPLSPQRQKSESPRWAMAEHVVEEDSDVHGAFYDVVGPSEVPIRRFECPACTTLDNCARPYPRPRALTPRDIRVLVQLYATAAKNAMAAGFDGVQIHGGNGSLIDQFLCDSSNTRADKYGGSIENRCRFLFEVVDAVVAAVGASRTALRLSPLNTYNDVHSRNPEKLTRYVCERLSPYHLAFLDVVRGDYFNQDKAMEADAWARESYKGVLVSGFDYSIAEAEAAVRGKRCDAVAFGVKALANPDLPILVQEGRAVEEREATLSMRDFYTLFHGSVTTTTQQEP